MKRYWWPAFSVVLFISALALPLLYFLRLRDSPIGGPSGVPRSPIVGEIRYDFPTSLPNLVVSHTFRVVDIWHRQLRLRTLVLSCICTQGHLVKSLLNPGQSTDLQISISLGPYQEQKELGAILEGQEGRTRIDFHYVFSVRAAYPLEFSDHS